MNNDMNMESVESYDNLYIDKVLSNERLKAAIDRQAEPGVINLIQSNWRDILYNNPVFQKHKDLKVKYYSPVGGHQQQHLKKHFISEREDKFQILVVGMFKVVKTENDDHVIFLDDCKPIIEIGNVMCHDAKDGMLKNCQFYMPACNGLCPQCRSHTIPTDNKWCASETKVLTLDGLQIADRFYCASVFRGSSIAIVRLEIAMKYYFGSNAKIGGNIKSIIFVQDSLLKKPEEITGFLNVNTNFVPKDEQYGLPLGLTLPPEEKEEYSISAVKFHSDV